MEGLQAVRKVDGSFSGCTKIRWNLEGLLPHGKLTEVEERHLGRTES